MSQSYLAKTINLCVPEDPVCAPGGIDGMAHGSYAANGMVAQAADFVAQQMG
jgi:cutinase